MNFTVDFDDGLEAKSIGNHGSFDRTTFWDFCTYRGAKKRMLGARSGGSRMARSFLNSASLRWLRLRPYGQGMIQILLIFARDKMVEG